MGDQNPIEKRVQRQFKRKHAKQNIGREKTMAIKDESAKKKNEIYCQRCHGWMAFEKFYNSTSFFFGWRCVICGDILDPVILLHRLSQDAKLPIPDDEKAIIFLIKKYRNSMSKEV